MDDLNIFYVNNVFASITLEDIMETTPWIQVTEARLECFMSHSAETYSYGSGRGNRTYTPVPYSPLINEIETGLNNGKAPGGWHNYNVCFLNRYDNAGMQLGWHSDDTPGMDHNHPIAVVSFGQPREIWWRKVGQLGVIPQNQRQLLAHGSLFVMPPGMQMTHQHRIPKGDRAMKPRVSLTFRHYVPVS